LIMGGYERVREMVMNHGEYEPQKLVMDFGGWSWCLMRWEEVHGCELVIYYGGIGAGVRDGDGACGISAAEATDKY